MGFNSKTDLDTVIDKICFKGTGNLYQYTAYLITVHRPLKYDRGFKALPSTFIKSHQPDVLHPVNSKISSRF